MNDEIREILTISGRYITNDEKGLILDYITNLQQDLANYVNVILHDRKVIDDYKSRVEKAIEYYKMHQQECVIGRNRDDKLIKDYYLPAQHSKVLLNILQNGSDEE